MDAGGYPNQDRAIGKEIFKGTMFGGVDVSREGGIAHCELGLLGGTVMEGKLYSLCSSLLELMCCSVIGFFVVLSSSAFVLLDLRGGK